MSLLYDLRKVAARNFELGLRPSGAESASGTPEARKLGLIKMLTDTIPWLGIMPSTMPGLGPTISTPLGIIERVVMEQMLRNPKINAAGAAGYKEGYNLAYDNPFLSPRRNNE
jgi:hypothetical protein